MIRVVTDSNSQIPGDLARRLAIEVVPLSIVVDGEARPEGDIDADLFFDTLARQPRPEVSTAAPSPGDFVEAYRRLAAAGATEIVSVHIGSELSATTQSARLAADLVELPVHVVDTAAASFVVGCAAWEAAEAAAAGVAAAEVVAAAEAVAASARSVFIVGALDLARSGGRFGTSLEGAGRGAEPVPVLVLEQGRMEAIGQASNAEEAVEAMAARILAAGPGMRVGISVADPGSERLWKGLENALDSHPAVDEMLRYRVGPSVAVHTGPGTAGAVYYRRPVH